MNILPIEFRRRWLAHCVTAALLGTLAGCGGGGLDIALPGTGGTGTPMMSFGSIRGFGSVIVNGIRFDDTQASVQLDGDAQSSGQLRLGMMAQVQGDFDAGTGLGQASRIDVWSIAQGTVTPVDAQRFLVAGMQVRADSATVLDGIASVASLTAGTPVRVWGMQADATRTVWLATRVERALPADTIVSTGEPLPDGAGAYWLNGMRLGGWSGTPPAGQAMRVSGRESGGVLVVQTARALSTSGGTGAGVSGRVEEVEGVVTALLSSTRFQLGASTVEWAGGALPAVGQRVEVYGQWVDGVLRASKIEQESEDRLQEVEIKGEVSAFRGLSDFVLRNQRCDASGAVQVEHGRLSDLRAGVKVKVEGVRQGDVVRVTKIEFDD